MFLGLSQLNLTSGSYIASAATVEELQKKIEELNASSQRIHQQVNQYSQELKETRSEISTLQNRLAQIARQIDTLELQIQETQNNIQVTELEIEQLRLKTNETEGNIDQNKENLAALLSRVHEFDRKTLIEVILGYDTLSDFLRESANVQSVQDSMKITLDTLKTYRDSLVLQRVTQEGKRAQLESQQADLSVQQQAVAEERYRQGVLLQTTRGEEREYQRLLTDAQKEEAALFKAVQELEKQVSIQKNYIKISESNEVPRPGTKIFFWPEDDPVLTQRYGMTSFALSGAYGGSIHNGIDMSAGRGSRIKAAQDGIIFASGTNKGWGNWVTVQHLGGLVTLYAHMIRPTHVAVGAPVRAGDTIGYEGSTGYSTGSHLHFSVYSKFFTFDKNGEIYFNYSEGVLNPLDYL
ncbi:MAG: hypothetical protein A2666_01700 [Parcubacteria group bacterium RIFCSPHIGHO2_01_FULL_47_10b]|nr:MAG: hypothetical protein A2666_01700 [Parcubacteria group bacterium RIFCSPHIGHO2_01_FULL_47_10b]